MPKFKLLNRQTNTRKITNSSQISIYPTMAATVHFLYPHEPEGSTFNMEHYSKKHLPQAAE